MEGCHVLAHPTTLKGVLNFLGALSQNSAGLKERVGETLERSVRAALNLNEIPTSVTTGSIKNNFERVIANLESFRKLIVGYSEQTSYENYDVLTISGEHCVDLCVKYIIGLIPQLYTTLSFLLFKVDETYSDLGGGGWESQECNSQDSVDSGKSLSNWLKSKDNGLPSAPASPSFSSPTLLPGGYGGDLGGNQGAVLITSLTDIISDSYDVEGGSLQCLLLDLATVIDWSPCSVSTHLTVLAALCEKSSTTLKTQINIHEGIQDILKKLPANLKLLTPDEDEDKEALLSALFDGSPKKYSKTLRYEAFESYMKWLKDNLKFLIGALNSLRSDCAMWNKEGLEGATISGPFGYGFWFSEKWDMNWKDEVKNKIPLVIQTLTEDLGKLEKILAKQLHASGSIGTSEASGHRSQSTGHPENHGTCTYMSSGTVSEVPVPTNLKEAIDWVLRVSNRDGQGCHGGVKGLTGEIEVLLKAFSYIKGENLYSKLYDVITALAEGLKVFVGYDDGPPPKGKGIASRTYKSTYVNDPKWDFQWNQISNKEGTKCAKILMGYAPLFYHSITYLYWRCADESWCEHEWEAMPFNGKMEYMDPSYRTALTKFMEAVGYTISDQLSNRDGGSVMREMAETLKELNTLSSSGASKISYSNYLDQLHHNGEPGSTSTPEKCPLYSLHSAAKAYWNSSPAKSSGINTVIEQIKETFDGISNTKTGDCETLRTDIAVLHEKLTNFLQRDSAEPGSDGPRKPGSSGTMTGQGQLITNNEQPQQETRADEAVGAAANAAAASGDGSGSVGAGGMASGSSVDSSQSQTSSAAPVTGTVATLALGGSGAAAYFLDLGGAKTLVNGLLGFH
ncbi:variant erythrocyte surface antigen-1 family protein [Babesia caballi]|uniref:Variant erythrocyte surface antigen-1 family protein n=1 Tax=Babesia caballi TaxID=5871 RepID=A0AAV4M2T9_BABCB|nr:variant erythrocyte surface antigen-1 family protein [Babesia caballi]